MAETLISPGVLARENDQSQVTQGPVQAGAAIVGPTVKGPVGIPTIVTSYSDYSNKFGTTLVSGGATYSYLTSIAAYNYFNNGGNTLLVTRVVTGSFTPAVSTTIGNSINATSSSFQLETLSAGAVQNNSGSQDSGGVLASGSADNIRWEIQSPNTSSGTFTLLIRRGDDNTNTPIVLETWSNISLDPFAPNYIEAVVGNQAYSVNTSDSTYYVQTTGTYTNKSRYVRVKSVSYPTPNFLNSNGAINSGSDGNGFDKYIPTAASGTFSGSTGTNLVAGVSAAFYNSTTSATNIQGISATSYDTSITLLGNKDDYSFNILAAPGLTTTNAPSQVTSLISTCQNRGDAIAVVDVADYGAIIGTVTNNAKSYNNSYAATYWPWLQTIDPDTGKAVFVPASTMIPGVYAYNDSVAEPWFAPAGINRGGLSTVTQAERRLSQTDRDTLYTSNVNPIATFPGTGVVVYGQKTLQKAASALDRVNVRRLLIALKSYISQIANNLVFEQNSIATRNNFLAQVNPYLESVQQRQGLYAFKVVMDDSNNTPDVIDRNQLVGQIYLQPTKTAEFVLLDFNVLPTGATFN
jgi:hypothetical protein